jgi:hypothetical protein
MDRLSARSSGADLAKPTATERGKDQVHWKARPETGSGPAPERNGRTWASVDPKNKNKEICSPFQDADVHFGYELVEQTHKALLSRAPRSHELDKASTSLTKQARA